MVITPDVPVLNYIKKGNVKYFELVAQPIRREILPGIYINAWGYNGSTPGPTIFVYPDDEVCIRVYNQLPQPTSVHWHGLDIPNNMDGVPAVEPSPKINPGCYFDYRFKITNPPGTHMYHSHFYTIVQDMMGLEGAFIILNPDEKKEDIQRDFFIMLGSHTLKNIDPFSLKKGVYDINPFSMDANFFTMNGRCFPYTSRLLIENEDNVRIRFGNIGIANHPIHFHGHQFLISASDGNTIKKENRLLKNTILIESGSTWDIEFYANNPGIWPLHCHFPHHVSNNKTLPFGGMATAVVYKGFDSKKYQEYAKCFYKKNIGF
ncbi:multicopper oxidase family protein [Tepidibacter hydrothermalis]|uniref:Copper oxidase n=1 Tax=Tepidibacter hydrothermalis TaxID=3036126 RepID=A0ABY8EB87_9FIRM|nr:copper oxidase [Tepidibacter hydrothermalis]WFD10164.1 copper oxidase [Tepidibacter hydrothermalis]